MFSALMIVRSISLPYYRNKPVIFCICVVFFLFKEENKSSATNAWELEKRGAMGCGSCCGLSGFG